MDTKTLRICRKLIWFAVALMSFQAQQLAAHGGVVSDEDLCIIEIGVFSAHFTVYQPETRASTEYCEDIPDVGEAVFVLDYLHGSLKEVPVDFRIVKDVKDLTIYAKWEDIRSIDDLEAATVLYQSPRIVPG